MANPFEPGGKKQTRHEAIASDKKARDPRSHKRFEDIPDRFKSLYKPTEGGDFVRQTALSEDEALVEAEKVVLGKVISFEWERGGSDVVHDYAKPWKTDNDASLHGARARGGYEVAGGSGTYRMVFPANYILVVEVDGVKHEVYVKKEILDAAGESGLWWAQMSEKRFGLLNKHIPGHVALIEKRGRKGKLYYELESEDAKKWIKKIADEVKK